MQRVFLGPEISLIPAFLSGTHLHIDVYSLKRAREAYHLPEDLQFLTDIAIYIMVSRKPDGSIYLNILYWGPPESGRMTSIKMLYKFLKQENDKFIPVGAIPPDFFDNLGILGDPCKMCIHYVDSPIYFRIYLVRGQKRFRCTKHSIYANVDGIVFVADSDPQLQYENIESLDEIVHLLSEQGLKPVYDVPFVFMLNKRDLPDAIPVEIFTEILRNRGFIFPQGHPLYQKSSPVYETIAIKGKGVVRAFTDCARRAIKYRLI